MCQLKLDAPHLSTLAADSSGQLDVFRHDGDSLGVDGAQVGVFEKTDQVGLASLLQGHDGRALEAQIRLEVVGDLTDQALEGQLADEQLGALLVTADLAKSDRARPVTMGLLHSTSSRCTLAGGLGRQLLSRRGLATGRFTQRCLLCTRHCRLIRVETVNVSDSNSAPRLYCVEVVCFRCFVKLNFARVCTFKP